MGQLIVPDYGQQFLLPPALEDWVGPDHLARFVREFVESVDLAEYGIEEVVASEGRPRYGASLLLMIWVYGYLHQIRSTRKLEAACRDQLPLIWLTGMIQPDHNSLWRFWREHKAALRAVYKQTVKVALHSGCVGLVLQAVDGTKIASWASNRTGWSKARMEKLLLALDESVTQTELQLAEEPEESVSYQLPAGLEGRQALRAQIEAGLKQIAQDERQHYHGRSRKRVVWRVLIRTAMRTTRRWWLTRSKGSWWPVK